MEDLLDLGRSGAIDPSSVITHVADMPTVLRAHETFDHRESGWAKAVMVC